MKDEPKPSSNQVPLFVSHTLTSDNKGPSTRKAPDFMIKLLALFDREAQGMVPMLGMLAEPATTATRLAFDWTPIPFSKTLKDSAEAVKALQA